MALRGNIKDVGITGLLQLIAQEQKTGQIEIKHAGEIHRISFDKGNMVGAVPRAGLLGDLMIRHGYIDEDDLHRALRIHEETLQMLGQILIKMGKITHNDLKHILNLQLLEGLRRVLPLKAGEFEFDPVEVDFDKEWIEPVPVDYLLIDGLKMVDEWPKIRKTVGSATGVPKRTKVTYEVIKEADADSVRILDLIDDEKNIEKIVHQGRLGEFETYRIVARFIKAGLVEVREGEEAPDATAGRGQGNFLSTMLRWGINIVLAAALILVIGILSATGVPVAFEWLRGGLLSSSDALARVKIDEIRGGLDIYYLENGEYPQSLSHLVEEGLIRNPWVIDPAKGQISYVRTKKSYHLILGREPLVRAGPGRDIGPADGDAVE